MQTLESKNVPDNNTKGKKRVIKKTHVIPYTSLSRLVHEIAGKYTKKSIWSKQGILALQEALEAYLVQRFRTCNHLAELCKKSTINKEIFDFFHTYLDA